ncbi:unannotated protein [freshwater metagenome]|uniref:Unannotated protein n=1 Tax=freshwater metagenome TaxID=449393 RepID=A0A6J6G414_9ZZZZ
MNLLPFETFKPLFHINASVAATGGAALGAPDAAGATDAAGVATSTAGSGSPSIHHRATPLIRMHESALPVKELTVLRPTASVPQVLPGAASPGGYPSSSAALADDVSNVESNAPAESAASALREVTFIPLLNHTLAR